MPSQPDPTAGQPWFCAPHLYSICIFLALVCFLGGRSWAAADTVLDRKVAFHIAAQPLDTALIEFSKQSGVTVSVAASSIHAVQAPAVSGTFAPGAALTELLDASAYGTRHLGRLLRCCRLRHNLTKAPDKYIYRL